MRCVALVGVVAWFLLAHTAIGAELASDQREVAVGYDRLEAAALRIADLAAPDDAARAEQIRETIRHARQLGLRERFDRVVTLLEAERLGAARRDQTELAGQLGELLRVLMADPNESRLEEERRRIERLAKELRGAIRTQKSLRVRTGRDAEGKNAERLAAEQGELAEQAEAMEASVPSEQGEGATSPPQEGPPQEGPAEPGRSGGESPPSLGGKIGSAERSMREAQRQIAQGKPRSAGEPQLDAQRALEAALRQAERRLKQLREEEQQRRLAGLAERIQRLLAEQKAIRETTAAIADSAASRPDRATRLAAAELTQRETLAIAAARRARRVVQEDGESLTFDEAFRQAIGDMVAVELRLRSIRLGAATLGLEDAVVASLEQMLAAVDQTLRDLQQKAGGKPSQGGGGGESSLVSQIAELRMLRSMQQRILDRTALWDEAASTGDATPGEVTENLRRLAAEQLRLAEAAAYAADAR